MTTQPPYSPEPQPWCWQPEWLPTGGFRACKRTKGHDGMHRPEYRPVASSAQAGER